MSASAFIANARLRGPAERAHLDRRELAIQICNQVMALVLLVFMAPLMCVVALMIWKRDGAPIFFEHYRVGRDGMLFRCLKFRTMLRNSDHLLKELLRIDPEAQAEWLRDQKLVNDPRITRIGRFLRSSSLDELPQLLNVLRGEMNLVGPRPVTVGELRRYGNVRWHYLSVRPGITGLWQVSGRNLTTYEERVELDAQYVQERSFTLDMKILFRTVWVVVTKHGAR